ncbi:Uncharacterised protein [Mycobacteroides abscessus subsp. abscessus]|nr:Uncharacterised protein [Mycobacteroides abscessus subsp. abscessus]
MVSMTVMGNVIHHRMGAGRVALMTLPAGITTSSDRKLPSLTGYSCGVVRHLYATCAQEMPVVMPEL